MYTANIIHTYMHTYHMHTVYSKHSMHTTNTTSCHMISPRFYTLPGLECGLKAQLEDLRTSFGPSAALMPTLDKLITPWAGLETTWTANIGSRGARCLAAGKEAVPGGLYLSPAPGEEFDLTVQLGDQLLNYVSSTVYMEVEHTSSTVPPGVLIQLNEIQYSFNDRYKR